MGIIEISLENWLVAIPIIGALLYYFGKTIIAYGPLKEDSQHPSNFIVVKFVLIYIIFPICIAVSILDFFKQNAGSCSSTWVVSNTNQYLEWVLFFCTQFASWYGISSWAVSLNQNMLINRLRGINEQSPFLKKYIILFPMLGISVIYFSFIFFMDMPLIFEGVYFIFLIAALHYGAQIYAMLEYKQQKVTIKRINGEKDIVGFFNKFENEFVQISEIVDKDYFETKLIPSSQIKIIETEL